MQREIDRKLVAVRTLVFQDEQVLLVGHRSPKTGRVWWMAPGGLVNRAEPAMEAAVREVKEEAGLDVEAEGPVYWLEWVWEKSYCLELYFLGKVKGGRLAVGSDPELDQEQQQIFDARFFELSELQNFPVYPKVFRTLLAEHWRQGFPTGAMYLGVDKPDLPR
ncbi:MAG: NUDIX domain-containing protein [Anaerolineae bacterium]